MIKGYTEFNIGSNYNLNDIVNFYGKLFRCVYDPSSLPQGVNTIYPTIMREPNSSGFSNEKYEFDSNSIQGPHGEHVVILPIPVIYRSIGDFGISNLKLINSIITSIITQTPSANNYYFVPSQFEYTIRLNGSDSIKRINFWEMI